LRQPYCVLSVLFLVRLLLIMEYIARIHNNFKEKFGIPRQSGRVGTLSRIVFEPKYRDPQSLRGIDGYSHLWILFDFSLAHRSGEWSPTVRPPRLGGNERMGVFATRSPFRPNNIGLSSVKLAGIDKNDTDGMFLIVEGADILDGTPVYDIKPYLPYCDCHTDATGGFSSGYVDYRLEVQDAKNLLGSIGEREKQEIIGCIAEDPRPAYKDDGESYTMRYGDYDIGFTVSDGVAEICSVKEVNK